MIDASGAPDADELAPDADELAPDADELARRLALLRFDGADAARIQAVAERLDPALPGVADELYASAATLDPLARLLDGHLDRRRTRQVTYLRQLLAARPDPLYAAARAWVGLVHRRIGLPLRWGLAALSVLPLVVRRARALARGAARARRRQRHRDRSPSTRSAP